MKILHIVGALGSKFGGPIRSIEGIKVSTPSIQHTVAGIQEGTISSNSSATRVISGSRIGRLICAVPGSVARLIDQEIPDIVHLHGALHLIYAQFAFESRKRDIPVIVSPRSAFQIPESAGYIRVHVRKLAKSYFDKPSSIFHCTSDAEYGSIGECSAMRVLIPNIFLRPILMENFKRKRSGFLYLGRISKRKNTDIVVNAWLKMPQTLRENHPLFIAGVVPPGEIDPLGGRLRSVAESAGVRFLGHVSGDRKEELLNKCKVLVHPSYFENFGHSIAEAIAAGMVPVVGPKTPFSDVLRLSGTGLVIDVPRNEEMLLDLMANATRLNPKEDVARTVLSDYLPEILGKSYDELYRSAISK